MKMSKRLLHQILVLLTLFSLSVAQDQLQVTTPHRIILNLTTEPATSMAVTWRTVTEVKDAQVQIAEAGVWIGFAKAAKQISARTEKTVLDDGKIVFYYSAVMNELKPNTQYAYRVGGDKDWSEWSQFTTAKKEAATLQCVFFGDPQDDIKEHVSRVFRQAYKKAPAANFWLFSGDLTSEPVDRQIEDLFYAAGFIFRMCPSVMVPGNHDNMYKTESGVVVKDSNGKKVRTKILPSQWRAQFTLPENGIAAFHESSYWLDYQGVRIIMLNSNDRLQEQAAWMDSVLADNPNTWTIVSFHHPLYSAGRERDDHSTRDAFLPIFDKYHVDLVLTGHDHAYARSYPLKNGVRVGANEKGTVYVVSVSGPKAYAVNSSYNELMAKTGGNVQLFQVITVDAASLSYQSYTVTGILYDAFELLK
jgi:acid phosphatase type 7